MNKCLSCQEETANPKFCSRSCSAKFNNKLYPKRKTEPQNKCLECNSKLSKTIGTRETQLCYKCYGKLRTNKQGQKTKKDCLNEKCSNGQPKNKYNLIRMHAKSVVKHLNIRSDKCAWCGYDKHTQLCHIKSISSFNDSAKLQEINSKENIIFLCPNCHWELDNLKNTEGGTRTHNGLTPTV